MTNTSVQKKLVVKPIKQIGLACVYVEITFKQAIRLMRTACPFHYPKMITQCKYWNFFFVVFPRFFDLLLAAPACKYYSGPYP